MFLSLWHPSYPKINANVVQLYLRIVFYTTKSERELQVYVHFFKNDVVFKRTIAWTKTQNMTTCV